MAAETIKNFLGDKKILIVDQSPTSADRLAKFFEKMEITEDHFLKTNSKGEALAILQAEKVGILFSDYIINDGSGFELFYYLKQQNRSCLQILFTANLTQSSVAKAAEEEVDEYIIKPFNENYLISQLVKAIDKKDNPDYLQEVKNGLYSKLNEEKLKAQTHFFKAVDINLKLSTAHYYLGEIEHEDANREKAIDHLLNATKYNRIHFKSLKLLFENYITTNDYTSAYEVIKILSLYYPSDPTRLSQGIHLCVRTHNFNDMKNYYHSFSELFPKPPEAVNYMGAGLFISGKYFFNQKNQNQGMEMFNYILDSCHSIPRFISAAVEVMVQHDCLEEATRFNEFLEKNNAHSHSFMISDFLLMAKKESDPHKVIASGQKLKDAGVRNNLCHFYLLQALEKAGVAEEEFGDFSIAE